MGLNPEALIEAVRAAAGERVRESQVAFGEATVVVHRDDAEAVCTLLRDRPELGFDVLVDVTAVDYFGKVPRFEVVYHLNSLTQGHRLRVKVRVGDEDAWAHSLTPLWKSANWGERECWDMYGIRFVGHPDPRRILMYEEFVGHPLRKDYPVDKRQPLVPERDPIETGWKF
jgi:NADH-quinone oxidoreductase subunit C